MKKFIVAILLPFLSWAQDYEIGKVTVAELSQKQHPKDTSAVAAILFNKGKTYFDFVENSHFILITEIEVKIKIYKKEGLDWANKEIAYYIGGDSDESVLINKAFTYNLVNGKIEKTKLNGEGEFKENVNKFWATKKITMPNVKEGSIIEYKYTIKSPYFSNLQDWKFQEIIPVDYSEYTTIIPEYYSYSFYSRGAVKLDSKQDTKYRTIDIYNKELAARGRNISYQNTTNRINLTENITSIQAKNVPALIAEEYTNNIDNYLSSIQYQLTSVQFPNQTIKLYSETWESVVKTINENPEFGTELRKENYFEDEYTNLISAKNLSNEAKINAIYDFVKNHYKWNETNGIYTDVGVNKAFKEKTGSVAEINFTLIAMLRKAGINANPILLATRSKAINLFPSTTAYNYVICGIENGDQITFLDATEKYLQVGLLPTRALNYIGRLIRADGTSTEIDLSPKKHAKNTVMIFATVEPSAIKGNVKETLTENRAFNFRAKNNGISEESYLENIEKNMPGFEITDYKIENKTEVSLPIKEDYNFIATNEIEVINDKIFFKPLLFFALDENPFKQESRDYPIDFKYPVIDNYTLTYNLPKGYIVESLPKQISLVTEDKIASFSFLIGDMGDKVQIVSNFQINTNLVAADYYDSIRGFFNEVFLKMNEKIVLKKKE